MRFLGNIIWLIFGGFCTAIEYFVGGLALCLTIIGIPFGIQVMKLGLLALWPFGQDVYAVEERGGCLSTVFNVIWLFIGGIWICLTHLLFGFILIITIIGIPFGKQHFKLAGLALSPFGREIR